jgi:hypothetical protein
LLDDHKPDERDPPPCGGFVCIDGEWCQLDGDDGE